MYDVVVLLVCMNSYSLFSTIHTLLVAFARLILHRSALANNSLKCGLFWYNWPPKLCNQMGIHFFVAERARSVSRCASYAGAPQRSTSKRTTSSHIEDTRGSVVVQNGGGGCLPLELLKCKQMKIKRTTT